MSKNACDLLISNGLVITMDAARTIYTTGAVAVTDSHIVEVGADDELRSKYDAGQTIDAAGAIVHPGFIDAHNHIVHTTCRGVFGNIHDVDASTIKFADWKADVTAQDESAATAMAALEMLQSGFTMFIEPGTLFSTDAAAAAVERVGMRALFSPPYIWDRRETLAAMPGLESPRLMARAPVDRDRAIGLLDAELHRNQDADALVRGFVFVYGVGTASPELLQAAHDCARANNVPLHLHAGYAPGEGEIYRSVTGINQLVHLHELGVLDANTVIVHANLLDDDEEVAIQESGCQIVWCPISFFSLGIARTAEFRMAARHRRGIPVSLAVDGAFDCTPAELMLAAHLAARVGDDPVSPSDLLHMQTLNAAAAAGLQSELGSLEPGKLADIVIRSPRAAGAYPANNPVHLLALTMGTGSVDTVLVNGEVVLRNGRSTRIDELEINRAVTASVAARAKRLGIFPGSEWPVEQP
ncbi:MAG: amidohydrolase family protein [Caldilineaceae bacterium]|nr:amidohydrolase family protein [Caldilineaceae bacterium]MDE0338316.1 amidohydrolase family protein [Caldilineaceae bacterium]